jgi:hypothetical protein
VVLSDLEKEIDLSLGSSVVAEWLDRVAHYNFHAVPSKYGDSE